MTSLPRQADVVIIGGGAIGISCAYFLQGMGREVVLLEKADLLSGCSRENAGLIVPSHIEPLATPEVLSQGLRWLFRKTSPFRIKPRLDLGLIKWLLAFRRACNRAQVKRSTPVLHQLLQASRHLLDDITAQLDIEHKDQGLLMVHHSPQAERHHLDLVNLANEQAMPVEIWDKAQLRQREPDAPQKSTGGIFFPQDTHLDPEKFFTEVVQHLQAKGASIYCQTQVQKLIQNNGKVSLIQTSRGDIEAKQVVLATGAWSPALAKQLNLKLPIQAGKGYTLTLPIEKRRPKIPMLLAEEKVSLTPLSEHLRFGGTLELAGLDPSVSLSRTHQIRTVAGEYCPSIDINSLSATSFWSGYRPCTPDGLPVIGWSGGASNLAIAAGHAMLGISLAPITGQLIGQLLTGQATSLDLAALAPQRFS